MGNLLTAAHDARCYLVETVPTTLHLPAAPDTLTTLECVEKLIGLTKTRLCVASFCCNLRSSAEGVQVLTMLINLARSGARVELLVDQQSRDPDADSFADVPNLFYHKVDIAATTGAAGGSLLSSFWVSDSRRFYLGSAALTGGSLSTIKTLGVYSEAAPLARDLRRRFDSYLAMARRRRCQRCLLCLPMSAAYSLYDTHRGMFFSDSPEPLIGLRRTYDPDAVVAHINAATSTIDMELLALVPLLRVGESVRYWPPLYEALLRAALERGVRVRVLIGAWRRADVFAMATMRSLHELSVGHANITVRVFRYPAGARKDDINNAKFLVADDTYAHITSANLDGTHFAHHAFVSFNCVDSRFSRALASVFARDWDSPHSSELPRLELA
uniref:Palmytilated EEV membrane glycoprotein n=1 Tax=Rousettus bat poxvirus TaxID=3141933 RepID=A0AAU7E1W6_9POXV